MSDGVTDGYREVRHSHRRILPDISELTTEDREDMIAGAVRTILIAIGENPDREGLIDTPKRVAKMYLRELCIGVGCDLAEQLTTTFSETHDQMVIVKDIPFHSLCEHHIVPYRGKAHIGYVPQGKVIGLSKLARVVEVASRRLTIQERLTNDIADAIERAIQPQGVIVVLADCEHMCMTMRGIRKAGSTTTTSAIRGVFINNPAARTEFLDLIK
jgi:GTP cyclohydrolase I